MATESTDVATDRSDTTDPFVPGATMFLYGLVAAGGGIALLNGIESYRLYAAGVPDPALHLVGTFLTLAVGFTFLLVALAGTISAGVADT